MPLDVEYEVNKHLKNTPTNLHDDDIEINCSVCCGVDSKSGIGIELNRALVMITTRMK